jgi:uncharacterized membrane protein
VLVAVLQPDLYRALKTLHILVAIVGFGAVMLNGVYASRAIRIGGNEGAAVLESTQAVANRWAGPFQYGVLVTGLLLVIGSDTPYGGLAWKFDQIWLSLSTVLYVGVIGVIHAVHRPNLRRMVALQRELLEMRPLPAGGPPPQVQELESRGRRAMAVEAGVDVIVVAILALMIWKPV